MELQTMYVVFGILSDEDNDEYYDIVEAYVTKSLEDVRRKAVDIGNHYGAAELAEIEVYKDRVDKLLKMSSEELLELETEISDRDVSTFEWYIPD